MLISIDKSIEVLFRWLTSFNLGDFCCHLFCSELPRTRIKHFIALRDLLKHQLYDYIFELIIPHGECFLIFWNNTSQIIMNNKDLYEFYLFNMLPYCQMVSIILYEAFHLKNPMLDDTMPMPMPMTKTINLLRYIQWTTLKQMITKYKNKSISKEKI